MSDEYYDSLQKQNNKILDEINKRYLNMDDTKLKNVRILQSHIC